MPLEVPLASRTTYCWEGPGSLLADPTIPATGQCVTAWQDTSYDPDIEEFGIAFIDVAATDPGGSPGIPIAIGIQFEIDTQDFVFIDGTSSLSLQVQKVVEAGGARETEDQILHVDFIDLLPQGTTIPVWSDDGVTGVQNPNNPWFQTRTRVADFTHVHAGYNVPVVIPLTVNAAFADILNMVIRRSNSPRLAFMISTESANGGEPEASFVIHDPSDPGSTLDSTPMLLWSNVAIVGTEDVLQGRHGPTDAMSRWDRCPKCGFYSLRETWILDGYREGLLVCEKCWEPEDREPRDLPPELPLVGEDG